MGFKEGCDAAFHESWSSTGKNINDDGFCLRDPLASYLEEIIYG